MSTELKNAFSVTRISFWTGVLVSSLVGSVLYIATARSIEHEAEERFANHARYAQSVIGVRIKSYTDLLRSTASMFHSADGVTHEQFHDYVQSLDLAKNFPAVDSFNFALQVPGDKIEEFQRTLQVRMDHHLNTGERLAISPPGQRRDYLVVGYFEPDPTFRGLYGIDLLANPYVSGQLLVARDENTLYASGTRIPPLSTPQESHLGMRMPVYRHGEPIGSVNERRAAYVGSLGIAFSVPKLLHGVLDEMRISRMRMTLFDNGPRVDASGREYLARPRTLFDSRGTAGNPTPELDTSDSVFSIRLPLDFNGRPWETVFSVPKSALYTEVDNYYPKVMMAFGFLGSILLYAMLHILASSRQAALALAREMTSELRDSQHKLQLSHQKLRRLADHAYQIKELERKRIAREIHDDLGQNLLALRIEAELLAARTKGTHSHLHKRARATLQQIDATIKSVRQIINDLRPTVLDLGLSAAVEWQVNQFQRRTGIPCQFNDDDNEIAVPDHCATAFFRILQEWLTNIVRHANASHVIVDLHLRDGWLSLTVKDNGCGLPTDGPSKQDSFGLVGIEERIVILGGTCAVVSEPGGGTTVTVTAPTGRMHDSFQAEDNSRLSGATVI